PWPPPTRPRRPDASAFPSVPLARASRPRGGNARIRPSPAFRNGVHIIARRERISAPQHA
ncbi:hypothetical protein, partial [Actinomyces sp. ICM58]|uniref:hypothetical protein n=1 Tax=Actinomyces sp. ICM58 TaxID=1105030 RepID=UPI001EE2019F